MHAQKRYPKRDFEFVPFRTGNQIRYYVPLQCSACETEASFETARILPDSEISKKIQEKLGWVMGRSRSFDLCPRCLKAHNPDDIATYQENKLAERFRVIKNGDPVQTRGEAAQTVADQKALKHSGAMQTVKKHLGKKDPETGHSIETLFKTPEQIAAEKATPETATKEQPQQPSSISVESRFEMLSGSIGNLAESMLLIAEQNEKIVKQTQTIIDQNIKRNEDNDKLHAEIRQQTEATARLAQLLSRQLEANTSSFRETTANFQETASTLREATRVMTEFMSSVMNAKALPSVAVEPATPAEVPVVEKPSAEQPASPAHLVSETKKLVKAAGKRGKMDREPAKGLVEVSKQRANTSKPTAAVTLAHSVLKQARINPDDRFVFVRDNDDILIRKARADETGVKVKRVGAVSVNIQTATLGDVDLFLEGVSAWVGLGQIRIQPAAH